MAPFSILTAFHWHLSAGCDACIVARIEWIKIFELSTQAVSNFAIALIEMFKLTRFRFFFHFWHTFWRCCGQNFHISLLKSLKWRMHSTIQRLLVCCRCSCCHCRQEDAQSAQKMIRSINMEHGRSHLCDTSQNSEISETNFRITNTVCRRKNAAFTSQSHFPCRSNGFVTRSLEYTNEQKNKV